MTVQYSLLLFLLQIQINLSSMLTVWHLQLEDKLLAPLTSFSRIDLFGYGSLIILSYQILSYLIYGSYIYSIIVFHTNIPYIIESQTIQSYLILSHPILSHPIWAHLILLYSILSHPIGAQQIMTHPLPLNIIWIWICFDIIISLNDINEFEFKGFSSAAIKEQMDSFFKSLPENFQMLSIMELAEPLLIQVKW